MSPETLEGWLRRAASIMGRLRLRTAVFGTLLSLVATLALWQVAFVLSGFDLDTDAYGHHGIAREIIRRPTDLSVHWVWLPLFHYLQAAFVPLGLTLTHVRLFNVLVSAAVPILLFVSLQERQSKYLSAGSRRNGVPFFAACLTALSPLSMQLGTTGQPEPLHTLLILATVHLLRRGTLSWGSLCLGLACLLRYEAWSVWLCFAALVSLDLLPLTRRFSVFRSDRRHQAFHRALLVLLPLTFVVGWAALRRPVDGEWFAFVKGTRTFATEALGVKSSFDVGGPAQFVKDLTYYAVQTAWACFGYPLLFVPLGLLRAFRREGAAFALPYVAIVAFITYVWLQRGSLGLMRHFDVLVPFYATLAAHGVSVLADGAESVVSRIRGSAAAGEAAGVAVIVGLTVASVGATGIQLDAWMTDWRDKQRSLFTDRLYVAAYLRSLPKGAFIFSDEPTLEVFSELDYRRFDRGPLRDDDQTVARVQAEADVRGTIYVATWSSKLTKLRAQGTLVFRPPASPEVFEKGFAVIAVTARDPSLANPGAPATR